MSKKLRPFLLVSGLLAALACTREEAPPSLELSLYSGIRGVVNINDTEDKLLENKQYHPEKTDLSNEPGVDRIKFTHMLFFKEIGTRAYFRNGRVALIEIQDPFQGTIQGKKLKVFKLANATPDDSWDRILIAEFGQPTQRMGGGSFSSEAMYYGWGDIAFNAKGPNEIAIYRDPEISKYRQTGFGRKIKIF